MLVINGILAIYILVRDYYCSLAIKVENIRENNYLRALKESRVVLVCQHLFNDHRKKINANVHQNTIKDGDSQTSLITMFFLGRGDVCTRANFIPMYFKIVCPWHWSSLVRITFLIAITARRNITPVGVFLFGKFL